MGDVIGAVILENFYDKAVLHLCQTTNYPKWQYKVYPSEMSVREKTSVNQQFVCLDGEEIVGAFVLNNDPQGKYENAEWTTKLLRGEYMVCHTLATNPDVQGKGIGMRWLNTLSVLQITVQVILLGKKCKPVEIIIQTILAFVYGYLTNLSCWFIKDNAADTYVQQLAYMVLSCFILAFGIWIQLKGNVVMLPGEAMNRAISMVTGKKYENIKIFF